MSQYCICIVLINFDWLWKLISFFFQVLQNFLETERAYINDIKNLLVKYVRPMSPTGQSDLLSKLDFKTLCGNLEAIFDFQTKFLREIEENSK